MRKIAQFAVATVVLAAIGAGGFVALQPSAKAICSVDPNWTVTDGVTGGVTDGVTDGKGNTSARPLFNHPMGLAWHAGALYVADTENGAVKKIGPDGKLIADWRKFKRPIAVAAGAKALYVADFLADRIFKLDGNGAIVGQWGRTGKGNGAFDAPSGIAVDAKGHVYVADFYNHRIQKFTSDGKFLRQWGGLGKASGRFRYPTEIAINARDEVFVADAYNQRIQRFNARGDYLGKWGGIGYGLPGGWPGWFRLPKAISADAKGAIYVGDAFNRRVQKFDRLGSYLGEWRTAGKGGDTIRYPAGISIDDFGRVYVSDFFQNRIRRLNCP